MGVYGVIDGGFSKELGSSRAWRSESHGLGEEFDASFRSHEQSLCLVGVRAQPMRSDCERSATSSHGQ